MKQTKVIGLNGYGIYAKGCGWEMDGVFYSDWRVALGVAREQDGKEPFTHDELQGMEDEHTDSRIESRQVARERRNERLNRVFIFFALVMGLVSCSKPPDDGILLTVKASNVSVIDHREIRLFFTFSSQGIEYTPADSTVVEVICKQGQYRLTLPANEASVFMLPGIKVADTTNSQATIVTAYNSKVNITF